MKRITVTLPDDLERELESYLAAQGAPPSLTTLAQTALRDYLRENKLRQRGYRPAQKPFDIPPLVEKDERGETDVSINHDIYLTER